MLVWKSFIYTDAINNLQFEIIKKPASKLCGFFMCVFRLN